MDFIPPNHIAVPHSRVAKYAHQIAIYSTQFNFMSVRLYAVAAEQRLLSRTGYYQDQVIQMRTQERP